jgi:hypothetical protein
MHHEIQSYFTAEVFLIFKTVKANLDYGGSSANHFSIIIIVYFNHACTCGELMNSYYKAIQHGIRAENDISSHDHQETPHMVFPPGLVIAQSKVLEYPKNSADSLQNLYYSTWYIHNLCSAIS